MNINDFCAAIENVFISKKDYVQNFDKWKPGSNNILYVTGLSGSGKSTLAEEYEKKYHAHMFELDGLQHNYDSSSKGILEKCKQKFPGFQDLLKSGHKLSHEEVKKLRCVIKYIEKLCKQDSNTLYIIEGVQLFYWFDPEEYKSKPMIIKGTSAIKSAYRANARDKSNDVQKGTLKHKIDQSITNDKRLTEFKKSLPAFESALTNTNKIVKSTKHYYIKDNDGNVISKADYYNFSNL